MGRGAYDLTDPAAYRSSAAAQAIQMHEAERAKEGAKTAEEEAAKDYAKLIKSKKSRGIVAARTAVKGEAAHAAKATKQESDDSDTTVKP